MSRKMINVIAVICTAVLALGIVGCGKSSISGGSDNDAVRAAIDEELAPLKDSKPENLVGFVDDVENEGLEALRRDYGVDLKELLSHVLRDFNYEISSVALNGNEAKVALNITVLNTEQAIAEASRLAQSDGHAAKIADLYKSGDANAKKELVGYTLDLIYQALDNTNDLTTSEVEVTLSKRDKKWKIDSDGLDELLGTILSGLDFKSV